MTDVPDLDRRPLKSRQRRIFQRMADQLVVMRVTPNAISVFGMIAGIASGPVLYATAQTQGISQRLLWLLAAGLIQLRLLCNMLDGMVAIGSGTQSKVGELYNEFPDRVSDSFTLIGLGMAIGGHPTLGYIAALLAMATAYVRAVGKAGGAGSDFGGPMAKPHRMFTTTVCCLACAASIWPQDHCLATWTLWIITIGTALTLLLRTCRIARKLRAV